MMILLAATAIAAQPGNTVELPVAAFGEGWEADADGDGILYGLRHEGGEWDRKFFGPARLTSRGGTTTLRAATVAGRPVVMTVRSADCQHAGEPYPFQVELQVEGQRHRGCGLRAWELEPVDLMLGDYTLDGGVIGVGINPAWTRNFGSYRPPDGERAGHTYIIAIEEPTIRGTTATYEVERDGVPTTAVVRLRACRLAGRRTMPFTIEVRTSTAIWRGCARQGLFRPPPPPPSPPMVTPIPPRPPTPPPPRPVGVGPTPARLRAGSIANADYPVSAIRAGAEGPVEVLLDVSSEGRVTGCTVLVSSGDAALDTTTCTLAQRRFRYTPATDAQGQPVVSQVRHRSRWVLPED